jgi:hypothetical protein
VPGIEQDACEEPVDCAALPFQKLKVQALSVAQHATETESQGSLCGSTNPFSWVNRSERHLQTDHSQCPEYLCRDHDGLEGSVTSPAPV